MGDDVARGPSSRSDTHMPSRTNAEAEAFGLPTWGKWAIAGDGLALTVWCRSLEPDKREHDICKRPFSV